MNKEEVVKGKNLFDEEKIIDTGMKGRLFVSIPFDEYRKLQKQNEVLKEVHKEFATLCRELKIYDTLMSAKSVMEKVVSKDKVKEILIRNKKALKLAQEQIEEEIIIADSDSLNAGRIQAHSLIITDLEKLLGDDKDE